MFTCVWTALPDPGAWHVCVLPTTDQVRRPSSVKLAQERQSRCWGTVSLCRWRIQPRLHLTR